MRTHSPTRRSIGHFNFIAMTNYVPSIPDCERWKKYVSNIANARSESKLNSYTKSKSQLKKIKVIRPVDGDLAIAETRVKKYKGKRKQDASQSSPSSGPVKKSKTAKLKLKGGRSSAGSRKSSKLTTKARKSQKNKREKVKPKSKKKKNKKPLKSGKARR